MSWRHKTHSSPRNKIENTFVPHWGFCFQPVDLRYAHFWRRWKEKWKTCMGFAAINDQLACDECLNFKEEYRNTKEPHRFCFVPENISFPKLCV